MDLFCSSCMPIFCYWLIVRIHFNTFVFCEWSRPTNKRNGEQKYITKKLASFIISPALSTKMELFQILCIHFDHKRGTQIVSSNTLRDQIFFTMNGILGHKMYDLYILLSVVEFL